MNTSYQSCRRSGWQEHFSRRGWQAHFPSFVAVLSLLFAIVPFLLASVVAAFGTPARGYDPILEGPRPGPCVGANLSTEYIGGADAYGRYVAPAGVEGEPAIHLDSETVYADVGTGGRGQADVAVDVKGLARALAAPTACSPRR